MTERLDEPNGIVDVDVHVARARARTRHADDAGEPWCASTQVGMTGDTEGPKAMVKDEVDVAGAEPVEVEHSNASTQVGTTSDAESPKAGVDDGVDVDVHVAFARARTRHADDAGEPCAATQVGMTGDTDGPKAMVKGETSDTESPKARTRHADEPWRASTQVADIEDPDDSRTVPSAAANDADPSISTEVDEAWAMPRLPPRAVRASMVRGRPQRMTMSPGGISPVAQLSSSTAIRLPRMTMSAQQTPITALAQAVGRMTRAVPAVERDEATTGAPQRMTMTNGRTA
jgi:hypothetical protein